MRTMFAAALVLLSAIATAQETPKPIAITIEPLGDREHGVMTRIVFRFANPSDITEAGLFLDGTLRQAGQVPRNFRYSVPRNKDRMVMNATFVRNRKLVRLSRYAVLPDLRNEISTVQLLIEGEAEIDAWLVLEPDYDDPQKIVAKAAEKFTVTRTGRPYLEEKEEEQEEEPAPPQPRGPVTIRVERRDETTTFWVVDADVLPPVTRVEFWAGGKRVLARNRAPYRAEFDLGDTPAGTVLRVIGFDAAGREVAADEFVVAAPYVAPDRP
jgi:hypothetical protein